MVQAEGPGRLAAGVSPDSAPAGEAAAAFPRVGAQGAEPPVTESIALRKVRSGVKRAAAETRRRWVLAVLKVWEPSLTVGRDVRIGRRVRFRITDGGRVRIGDGTTIDDRCVLEAQEGVVEIGSRCYVGIGTHVAARQRVRIGDDALIAQHCVIRDQNHRFSEADVPIRLQGFVVAPVEVGADVWLGANVVVTAGSSIGSGCVIGANAVVRGTIPALSVATGIPAEVVRRRGAP